MVLTVVCPIAGACARCCHRATTARFATLQAVLIARGTRALLIGIGGTLRRQTDYNFPGASAYHDFLTLELIPQIEARFRCDLKRRNFS